MLLLRSKNPVTNDDDFSRKAALNSEAVLQYAPHFRPKFVAQRLFICKPGDSHNPGSTSTDQLPEFIAHYRILRRLGKGGMGEVFSSNESLRRRSRKIVSNDIKLLPI